MLYTFIQSKRQLFDILAESITHRTAQIGGASLKLLYLLEGGFE